MRYWYGTKIIISRTKYFKQFHNLFFVNLAPRQKKKQNKIKSHLKIKQLQSILK